MSPSTNRKNSSLGTGLASAGWFRRGEDTVVSHRKDFDAQAEAHER